MQRDAIGTAQAFRINQGVNNQRIGCEVWTFDPDRADRGELLATRIRHFDGKSTRHGAESLSLRNRAEETRALERCNSGQPLSLLRNKDTKTGKTDIADMGNGQLAEVELRDIVDDPAGLTLRDEIDLDRGGKDESPLQGLDRKAQIFVRPDAGGGLRLYAHILVVIEMAERVGEVFRNCFERFFGRFSGKVCHEPRTEWCRGCERKT